MAWQHHPARPTALTEATYRPDAVADREYTQYNLRRKSWAEGDTHRFFVVVANNYLDLSTEDYVLLPGSRKLNVYAISKWQSSEDAVEAAYDVNLYPNSNVGNVLVFDAKQRQVVFNRTLETSTGDPADGDENVDDAGLSQLREGKEPQATNYQRLAAAHSLGTPAFLQFGGEAELQLDEQSTSRLSQFLRRLELPHRAQAHELLNHSKSDALWLLSEATQTATPKLDERENRQVRVVFDNGDSLSTSMAANLSDEDILAYYKVGKTFNLGNGERDRQARVKQVQILEASASDLERVKQKANDLLFKELKVKDAFQIVDYQLRWKLDQPIAQDLLQQLQKLTLKGQRVVFDGPFVKIVEELAAQDSTDSINEGTKLRSVKVTWSNGETTTTSMAAGLSDKEILDYYKIGKTFNLGKGERDSMVKVKEVEILEQHLDESLKSKAAAEVVVAMGLLNDLFQKELDIKGAIKQVNPGTLALKATSKIVNDGNLQRAVRAALPGSPSDWDITVNQDTLYIHHTKVEEAAGDLDPQAELQKLLDAEVKKAKEEMGAFPELRSAYQQHLTSLKATSRMWPKQLEKLGPQGFSQYLSTITKSLNDKLKTVSGDTAAGLDLSLKFVNKVQDTFNALPLQEAAADRAWLQPLKDLFADEIKETEQQAKARKHKTDPQEQPGYAYAEHLKTLKDGLLQKWALEIERKGIPTFVKNREAEIKRTKELALKTTTENSPVYYLYIGFLEQARDLVDEYDVNEALTDLYNFRSITTKGKQVQAALLEPYPYSDSETNLTTMKASQFPAFAKSYTSFHEYQFNIKGGILPAIFTSGWLPSPQQLERNGGSGQNGDKLYKQHGTWEAAMADIWVQVAKDNQFKLNETELLTEATAAEVPAHLKELTQQIEDKFREHFPNSTIRTKVSGDGVSPWSFSVDFLYAPKVEKLYENDPMYTMVMVHERPADQKYATRVYRHTRNVRIGDTTTTDKGLLNYFEKMFKQFADYFRTPAGQAELAQLTEEVIVEAAFDRSKLTKDIYYDQNVSTERQERGGPDAQLAKKLPKLFGTTFEFAYAYKLKELAVVGETATRYQGIASVEVDKREGNGTEMVDFEYSILKTATTYDPKRNVIDVSKFGIYIVVGKHKVHGTYHVFGTKAA